jgi:hypothetical protein
MNKEPLSTSRCERCGRPAESDRIFCAQCMIEEAEERIPDKAESLSSPPVQLQGGKGTVIRVIILLFCLAVITCQMPKLLASFKAEKPLRLGTYETDAKTDQCIANLWHLARLLQDNGRIDDEVVCPASGKPYIVTGEGADFVVRCPEPSTHGFREISASTSSPRPKVIPDSSRGTRK